MKHSGVAVVLAAAAVLGWGAMVAAGPSATPAAQATAASAPLSPTNSSTNSAAVQSSAPVPVASRAGAPAAPSAPKPSALDSGKPSAAPAAAATTLAVLKLPSSTHLFDMPSTPTPGGMFLVSAVLPHYPLSRGELALSKTADESYLDPINWDVMAYKSAHLLKVYYKGALFGSYNAVFGRNPDPGAKEWEGDLRTPEGVYEIVRKHPSRRWQYFLQINYPNDEDYQRYQSLLDRGLVPVIGGHIRHLGAEIGIHGTDRPRFNRLQINWTLGCISVDSAVISELDRLLPVGTLVIIKP